MQVTYPGVYRKEIPTQRRVVQDVSTANLALVSAFQKGPVNEPVFGQDLDEQFRVFGNYWDSSDGPHALSFYYAEGGQNSYVVRVVGAGAAKSVGYLVDEYRDVLSGADATGGGAVVLNFSAADVPIAPGSVRLFFTETLAVAAEAQGTTDGTADPITGTLGNFPVVPGSVNFDFSLTGPAATTAGDVDQGDGTGLLTVGGHTGTITYATGAYTLTPSGATEAADPVTVDYEYAVANAAQSATIAGVASQRVYHSELSDLPVYHSVQITWTDQTSTARSAQVSSAGALTGGEATGTLDLVTGVLVLDLGANEVEDDGVISINYSTFAPLTAEDDGAGVLTVAGGLLGAPGTVDYATGAISGTTVALIETAAIPVYYDYDARTHEFQAVNQGLSGDELRVSVQGDPNYIDAATGNYTKFDVLVEEADSDGLFVVVDPFEEVVLNSLTNSNYISQVINDEFKGSDLVEVLTTAPSVAIPTALQGSLESGVLCQTGTGAVLEVVTSLPLNGGSIIAGSVTITYTAASATRTVTDNGQGALQGDLDAGQAASIDYTTGLLVFTPDIAPDNATDVEAAFTLKGAAVQAQATFTGGADGAAISRSDVTDIGLSATDAGIYALDAVNDILILVLPDFVGDQLADAAAIAYVENTQTRDDSMYIFTAPEGATVAQAIDYKQQVLASNSNRAAMYYPHVYIDDPLTKRATVFPPMGHIAGVWSRTDLNRNVAKVPAGTVDGRISNIIEFERVLTDLQVGQLTKVNINALWKPPEQPRCVWGARTLEVGGEYRYINKRRTMDFVSVSIAKSMWWAVFENSGPSLWTPIREQIRAFLLIAYRRGLLAGANPKEAFFVTVDASNNPPEVTARGEVIVDYGIATQTPGEFIILQHRQVTLAA